MAGRGVVAVAVAAASCSAVVSAAAETIAVVTDSPRGEAAAEFLATQISDEVVLRRSDRMDDPTGLLVEARRKWPERLVVVLDARHAVVRVIRPSDGTITARTLDAAAADAPYAISLAAVELLGIVRAAPRARSASLPPPATPAPAPEGFTLGPVVAFGVQQTLATNGALALIQPTLAVDARWLRPESGIWFSLGLHAAGLTSQTRDQLLVLPNGPQASASVEYARNEVALRVGAGHREGIGSIAGWTNIGAAFVDVEARDELDLQVEADRRTAFWLGIGGELRYGLGRGVSAALGAGGAFYPVTSRFFATPEGTEVPVSAFEESHFELRGRLVIVWEWVP